ncbi:hypothetical protein K432DRAFT_442245 [Lepidopterella palustris CBS 459.81]|uniref:Phytochrome n=1 Tax=Lepidopterella palustris CBS 459.81 TaxID=1314670 RepID=A0A8E2ECS6_9PEZI|nr:hypothetical protein K432DRAFT_442245 [Lepidopterella palustris CBS 459.81]
MHEISRTPWIERVFLERIASHPLDASSSTESCERAFPIRVSIASSHPPSLTSELTVEPPALTILEPIYQPLHGLPSPDLAQSAITDPPSWPPDSDSCGAPAAQPAPSQQSDVPPIRPAVTERYEYVLLGPDTHGVVSGTRREFRRCEDEQIHIPGAIQSFGMLVALEVASNNRLIVRIASENCEALCHYSPAQLFELENFLNIFPDNYRTEFDANAWLVRKQYSEFPEASEPKVFSTAIRNSQGAILPLNCAMHWVGNAQNLICEFEWRNLGPLRPGTPPNVDSHLPREPVNTLNLNPTEAEGSNSKSKPLLIHRLVHGMQHGEGSTTETVNTIAQIQQQFNRANSIQELHDLTVRIVQALTKFHRVMIYQFDQAYNGTVVAEAINTRASLDLFKGLRFPASDIPAQARALYQINKVRLLFDREEPTARLVCRSQSDLEVPLDLTHAYLRAMSPIHIRYLANMGVRSTLSVSLDVQGRLWGLICCHSYGPTATEISFPIREVLYWIGLCVSNCIEKLSLGSRLESRRVIDTIKSGQDPNACITASSADILALFQAHSGLLVIGGEARTIGRHESYQEAVALLQYIHFRRFRDIKSSHSISADFPDLVSARSFRSIAGFLFIPLSLEGPDYIIFFRNNQLQEVHWAGNPYLKRDPPEELGPLEPRSSFKKWTERVVGTCHEWTEQQFDSAAMMRLVYGKFVEVWREKEKTVLDSRMKRILLLNASHEVRTPLNAVINYLEIALERPLDPSIKDALEKSHTASKSLVHVIDNLLDITKSKNGRFPLIEAAFDIRASLNEILVPLKQHASHKLLTFEYVEHAGFPQFVKGDLERFQQVVSHIVSNSIRHTTVGGIVVEAKLESGNDTHCILDIITSDTGSGLSEDELDDLFQDLEQVSNEDETGGTAIIRPHNPESPTVKRVQLGLGFASAARFVRIRDGQLRVRSHVSKGTTVTLRIPFPLSSDASHPFQALSQPPTPPSKDMSEFLRETSASQGSTPFSPPAIPVKMTGFHDSTTIAASEPEFGEMSPLPISGGPSPGTATQPMVVVVADDNLINLHILQRRLERMGHKVLAARDGQECFDIFKASSAITDFILMDLDMPVVDGYASVKMIRALEKETTSILSPLSREYGRTPIFAVSATLSRDMRQTFVNKGFDGWMVKPVSFNRLSLLLLSADSPDSREQVLYDPTDFEQGGWFSVLPQNS